MTPLVKIFSTLVAVVAGAVGSKAVSSGWTAVTGNEAPTKKNKDAQQQQSVVAVAAFAAISAAVMAIVQAATQRGAQKFVARAKSDPEEV